MPAYALSFLQNILNSTVIASIILLVGFISGRLSGLFVRRFLDEMEVNKALKSVFKVSLPFDDIASFFISFSIYFLSIIAAIDVMNLNELIFNILGAAIVLVIVVSIIFSLAEFTPNLFSGVFLHTRGIVHEGDIIKVGGVEGKIISIDLVDTKLASEEGDVFFVPNSYLVKNFLLIRKRKLN